MKKTVISLIVCCLCPPLFAQQGSVEQLKDTAGAKELPVIAEPAPVTAAAAKEMTAAEPGFPKLREVKFLFGKQARTDKSNCTVTAQDGTMDIWECRNSDGKYRCYAEVTVDGKPFRVYGGCASSFSDCWSTGSSAVQDPCDSIESQGGGDPQPAGDTCTIKDQSSTIDVWACRDSEGKQRCYADAYINGSPMRIYGSCTTSMSDCWSTGSLAVNPCD